MKYRLQFSELGDFHSHREEWQLQEVLREVKDSDEHMTEGHNGVDIRKGFLE